MSDNRTEDEKSKEKSKPSTGVVSLNIQDKAFRFTEMVKNPRFLRPNKLLRGRRVDDENIVQFDLTKDLRDHITEILTNLCQIDGISTTKKLAYLNAFIKLIASKDRFEYGYSIEEIFYCLRVGLIHEAMQVRAATLRTLRYLLKIEEDVLIFNKLHFPYLLARSIDVSRCNEIEQIQSLKLIRRILALSPKNFSPTIARSLISIINTDIEDRKQSFYVFLAILCELGVLNVTILISCGGVSALARITTIGEKPAITEAILGVLLHLIAYPETRNSVSLLCLAAPYCELQTIGGNRTKEDWEKKFITGKSALLTILRSYPGVIHFCHPYENSGLKSIVDILYVERLEVRKAILELFYELLEVPLPIWTDEPDVAVAAVNPSRFRDSWKLSEGFVAEEGKTILPTLICHCPNITELHLALLVHVLLECGLHKALAETIVTSDTFISVRSAVLLGMVLHLAHSLLPSEVYDLTLPLPNLLEHASSGRHQALGAVTILGKIHAMMRKRPTPSSLFLDRLLQPENRLHPVKPKLRRQSSLPKWIRKLSPTSNMLKDSQVLSSKDALAWNWTVVRSVLRSHFEDPFGIIQDSDHRVFIKKLVKYFKPSSNLYCRVELSTNSFMAREKTLAGCELINCLLVAYQEGDRLLLELMEDIASQIMQISNSQSAHDCLFSPRHVTTTCCQYYFLFIGQLSDSLTGRSVLEKYNLLKRLKDLALKTNHECYVKLILSCLDYSQENENREILKTVILDSLSESTRLYGTQFLLLLLRARIPDATKWSIALLVNKLSDSSKTVAFAALEALQEVAEDSKNLELIFQEIGDKNIENWNQWLDNCGDQGYLFKTRFYSLKSTFTILPSPAEELEKWINLDGFSRRYVGLVEEKVHDSIIKSHRMQSTSYSKWKYDDSFIPKDVYILPHLLGQLVQHELGLQLLLRRNVLQRFLRVIQRFRLTIGKNESSTKNCSQGDLNNSHSEEFAMDETIESNRLETIIDSEIMETLESIITEHSPTKNSNNSDRKLSLDESIKITPEKKFVGDYDLGDERSNIEEEISKVKAAIWALGHIGTSSVGVEHLNHLGIIEILINVAENCPYYSVRATAMYTLSLISTIRVGADLLTSYNWPCVRYKRGELWPHLNPFNNYYQNSSPISIPRHHRSLSDGKSEFLEMKNRRTRIRSESAATEMETKKYLSPGTGETLSPLSSTSKLNQQDLEGYAKLRNLHNYRRPTYSHSSLEMYSLDGRLSLQSISAESSEQTLSISTPPYQDEDNSSYMGICLPKKLSSLFHNQYQYSPLVSLDNKTVDITETKITDQVECIYSIDNHIPICLVCSTEKNYYQKIIACEERNKLRKEILRLTQHLANPVYCSRMALLRLRQQHPEMFQDSCIYSDIAAHLANNTYKMKARIFIQELFLDATFITLYIKPMEILKLNLFNKFRNNVTIDTLENSSELSRELENLNCKFVTLNLRSSQANTIQNISSIESSNKEVTPKLSDNKQETEKSTDEKIIAEILKPEEKLRSSKGPEKPLRTTKSIDTA